MGSSASVEQTKKVYLEYNGREITVEFSQNCSTRDLKELLTSAAGLSRWSTITLTKSDGSVLALTPSLPNNSPASRYHLRPVLQTEDSDREVLHDVLSKVSEEFNKAFKIQEFTADFNKRLQCLEGKMEAEGLKSVEIDKCKQELQDIKGKMFTQEYMTSRRSVGPRPGQKRDVPHYPKYVLSKETVAYLKKPTFDIWHWEPNEMLCLMEHMYHQLGLVTALNINPITLKRWLLAVQENYRDNPFHNFRHCFCVTQMMYGMVHLCNLQDSLSPLEVAVLITAAACHDLDHPGFNNNYQINARTELAIRYNDKSPLENHHCAVAFQILEKPETNLFAYVTPEDFKKIRAGIIELILATDMARHNEIMQQFKSMLTARFDSNNQEHRKALMVMLIKSCDISNEVRPMEVSEPWVDCLLEEYFLQSDREKSEGLPVAAFMDRDKVTKPTAQIGFIKFVLIPVFEAMSQLFPQLEDSMISTLKSSQEHYEQLKKMDDLLKEEGDKNMSRGAAGGSLDIIAVPLTAAVRPRASIK